MTFKVGHTNEMSEGEYQYWTGLCESFEGPTPPALEVPAGKWQTRDGKILAVRAMSEQHLKNAIGCFTRAGWGDHPKMRELEEELLRRR